MSLAVSIDKLHIFCRGIGCPAQIGRPMREMTSFKIGGPADILVSPTDPDMVATIFRRCAEFEIPVTVIGRGTNLLVSDEGVRGCVVHIGQNMAFVREENGGLVCGAGTPLSQICSFALSKGLAGLEFAWGIPGNAGGALAMNAGAYGGEMRNIVLEADYLTRSGESGTIPVADMVLRYRRSVFLERDLCVTSVKMRLDSGDPAEIREKMDDIMARRRDKQPLEFPSAGSTFKRPEGSFAGMLIQQCGLKGYSIGGAQISEKHAGFIINTGDASCADVEALIHHVQQTVQKRTGYLLECEVRRI